VSCLGPRLRLAIDDEVNALVVEAHEAGDSLTIRDRCLVAPYEVVVDFVADLDRPVGRLTLNGQVLLPLVGRISSVRTCSRGR
jgi:hypothetical protein